MKNILRNSASIGLLACLTGVAVAHAELRQFNIPEGEATRTIPSFARQSGLQIIVPAERLKGQTTQELRGELDAQVALEKLLEGTDLKGTVSESSGSISLLKKMSSVRTTPGIVRVSASVQDEVSTVSEPVQTQSLDPAPTPVAPPEDETATLKKVVIVGSQIAGAKPTGVVPVTVMSDEQIAALGVSSGEDLYRSLPIAGDVSFNTQWLSGGSQGAARGDVSSVNLRGLGSNYTLLMLNGRRTVQYPLTQGRQVSTYNANAIPVFGLQRLEILKDGAAALYGSDAVAGVVNNVLLSDFDGLKVQAQYGLAEDTNLTQFQANLVWGKDFANGRGNLTTFLNYSGDSKLYNSDQDYTASQDLRPLIEGTSYAGSSAFDSRGTTSPWGGFRVIGAAGPITVNGQPVTDASGQFHIQPTTSAGCIADLGAGLCIDDGLITSGEDRNLRFDQAAAIPGLTVTPSIDRVNLFNTLTYELNDSLELFAEAGIYYSKTESLTTAVGPLGHTPVAISAGNYYNPFGAIGSVNRIDGLDAASEGLDVLATHYLLADAGGRDATVETKQHRLLLGLKGEAAGWDWESAILYSDASAEDVATNYQASLWQDALSLTTPDAYNPFNGSNLVSPSLADTTINGDFSSFRIDARRYGSTSLASYDFKVSRPDLLSLPAGDVGVAAGAEIRWETSEDDRDSTGDFTTPFVDAITGLEYPGDTVGASAAWDVKGNRMIYSAFAELAVPVISPEMNIPLVRAIDLQLAGRFEEYDDVGSVAKPKVAGSWDVLDGLRLRSSWQQGFVAPSLQQLAPVSRNTSQNRLDDVLCELDLRAGRIATWSACAQRPQIQVLTSGNADLEPEESESLSYGFVLESTFMPQRYGQFTFTYDKWKIDQENLVGTLTAQNAITLDYLLRVQGSSNPNVVREDPTAAEIADAAGTGLDPVGRALYVATGYTNLESRSVEGYDVGLTYSSPETEFGSIDMFANASVLTKFFQNPSDVQQELLAAQAAGLIDAAVAIGGAASVLEDGGNPKLKWSAGVTWKRDQISIGLTGNYTGKVYEYDVVNADNQPWEVEDQLSIGLWGDYQFEEWLGGDTSVRLGVRNLADEQPPLASSGYLGNLYQPYARYWYARIQKSF